MNFFQQNDTGLIGQLSPITRWKMMMESQLLGPMTKYWLQGGRWDKLDSDYALTPSPFNKHFTMMLPNDQQKLLEQMGFPAYYSNMPQIGKGPVPYMPMREYGPDIMGKPKRKT